jgi:hypothetical protein
MNRSAPPAFKRYRQRPFIEQPAHVTGDLRLRQADGAAEAGIARHQQPALVSGAGNCQQRAAVANATFNVASTSAQRF